jgi:hypothetical protein
VSKISLLKEGRLFWDSWLKERILISSQIFKPEIASIGLLFLKQEWSNLLLPSRKEGGARYPLLPNDPIELKRIIASQEELILALEDELVYMDKRSRRVRICSDTLKCQKCGTTTPRFMVVVGKNYYTDSVYNRLRSKLRKIGIFVKETWYKECPPEDGKVRDSDVDFLPPKKDLRELPIPQSLGDEFDKLANQPME